MPDRDLNTFMVKKIFQVAPKRLILFTLVVLLFAACSKNNDLPEEKPILSLLDQPGISIDTVEAAVDWVYGFQFKVKGDGVISQIGMKVPVTGDFTATLWDIGANKVLKEMVLTANSPHEEVFEAFDGIDVSQDQTLGITIKADGYYKIKKTDNSSFAFPIEKNTISILSFHEVKASELPGGSFPLTINNEELSPCIDVVFIDQ